MYNGAVHANVAQLVEHVIRNDKVASSILAIGSIQTLLNNKKEGAVQAPSKAIKSRSIAHLFGTSSVQAGCRGRRSRRTGR